MCNVEGPPLRAQVPRMMAGGDPLPIYLDHNATTPVAPEAWKAMMACQHVWGNPSSTHPYGLQAKFVIDTARADVAKALGVDPSFDPADCIIFTSCGTEANNLAIEGTIHQQRARHGRHIIVTSNVEHPATAEALKRYERGAASASSPTTASTRPSFEVLTVPVDPSTGVIDLVAFERLYAPVARRVALVTIMHANNETGSIQPLKEITAIVAKYNADDDDNTAGRALVHADCAQSIGKIPLTAADLGIDLMSVVGHKFYAPKGVACLYRKPSVALERISFGAGHEKGLRPGTENIVMINGFAAALTSAMRDQEENAAHMRLCRDALLAALEAEVGAKGCEVLINGSLATCLPNTLNCAIRQKSTGTFISGNRLLLECGAKVAASAGSACHSTIGDAPITVSKPLQAVGVWLERAMGTLRLSTGKMNAGEEEMRRAAKIIGKHAVQQFADW